MTRGKIMNYYEKALKLNADGIDFMPICSSEIIKTYTIEELKYATMFPKSNYKYYKMIDRKKKYIDNKTGNIEEITISMLENKEDSMIRASNKAGLTRNQLLDTLFEKGVLAVYNLGMQHMYEYLEE